MALAEIRVKVVPDLSPLRDGLRAVVESLDLAEAGVVAPAEAPEANPANPPTPAQPAPAGNLPPAGASVDADLTPTPDGEPEDAEPKEVAECVVSDGTPNGPAGYAEMKQEILKFRDLSGVMTCTINDIEIFGTGTWKGIVWKRDDLVQIAENYNALRDRFEPPLKIGHYNAIVEASHSQDDSMPAIGWATSLRVVDQPNGAKLIADFSDVPKMVRDVIARRGYRRVSAEIYSDFVDGATGKRYGRVLRAVALLGAELPEVKTLKDVLLLYGEPRPMAGTPGEYVVICTDSEQNNGGSTVTPEEIAALKAQMAEVLKANQALQAQNATLMSETQAQKIRAAETEAKAFCESLKGRGIITPALEPLASAALLAATRLETNASPDQALVYSEASNRRGLAQSIRDLLAAIPPVVVLAAEIAPAQPAGAAPIVNQTPGMPPAQPTALKPKVQMHSDGLEREWPVQGGDTMAKARAYMTAHPGVGVEKAIQAIQLAESGRQIL